MSLEKDVSGYGTGIGPAGGDGGVRQTSGNAAITLPSPALQAISSPLAYTSQPITLSLCSPSCAVPSAGATPHNDGSAIAWDGTRQTNHPVAGSIAFAERFVGQDQLRDP